MIKKSAVQVLALLMLAGLSPVWAAKYTIDSYHSDVTFKIRHMMISKVSGSFGNITGEINYDEKNPTAWSAAATVDVKSVNTNNADRDKHLRSPDFFDTEKFPVATFKSSGIQGVSGSRAKINGVLMLHGVEKPVTLDLEVGGMVVDRGMTKVGFEATTTINRKDFGINYNKILDNGGLALGEEVEISIHIEANLDAPKKEPAKK